MDELNHDMSLNYHFHIGRRFRLQTDFAFNELNSYGPRNPSIHYTHSAYAKRILFVTHLISMYCFGHLTGIQRNFPYELKTFFARSIKWKYKKRNARKKTARKKHRKMKAEHYLHSRSMQKSGCLNRSLFENEHFNSSLFLKSPQNIFSEIIIIIWLICV